MLVDKYLKTLLCTLHKSFPLNPVFWSFLFLHLHQIKPNTPIQRLKSRAEEMENSTENGYPKSKGKVLMTLSYGLCLSDLLFYSETSNY